MLVNKSSLEGVYKNFRAIYDAEMPQIAAFDYAPFVMDIPSNTITESYNWLSGMPGMNEWIGDRLVRDLKAHNYDVSNTPYESTLAVKRRDIETDRLGIYLPQVKALAFEAKDHPARLFATMLDASDSTVCFDGQYLIDTDHPNDDGTTWSNKSTSALTYDTLKTNLIAMGKLTDGNSKRRGVRATVLMVPVDLEFTAYELCYSTNKPGSMNNDVNAARELFNLKVVVNPYLTDTNNWYLIDTTKPVKPAIFQHRKLGEFVAADDPSDTTVFMRNEFYYGIDGDYAMAAGFPHVIFGAIVT